MDLKKILDEHLLWLNGEGGSRANLFGANLRVANLRCADLRSANLRCADLRNADLRNADLCRADLRNADLCCASMDQMIWNIHTAFYPLQCPDSGSYIGYKKASGLVVELEIPADARRSSATSRKCRASKAKVLSITDINGGSYIGYKKASGLVVELEIPADARRSSATSRKCRASKAKVLSITDINGNPGGDQVRSNFDPNFVYAIGETVEVTDFDDNRWNECSTGIHHFITRAEAVIYQVRSNFDPNFVYAIGETVEVTDFDDNRWNECSTGIHHFITRAEAVIYK